MSPITFTHRPHAAPTARNRTRLLLGGLVLPALIGAAQPSGCEVTTNALTGLAYDQEADVLVMSKTSGKLADLAHIQNMRTSLVFVDRAGTEIDEIDTSGCVSFLEGVAHVPSDDTFWVWGVKKGGMSPSADVFCRYDRNGVQLGTAILGPDKPGMLAYDELRDGIWAKADTALQARLYAPDMKSVRGQVNTGVGGEGITVSPSDGKLFLADNDSIYTCAPDLAAGTCAAQRIGANPAAAACAEYCATLPSGDQAACLNNVHTGSNMSEGLAFDPADSTLWFSVDLGIHCQGLPDGNRVYHLRQDGSEITHFTVFPNQED